MKYKRFFPVIILVIGTATLLAVFRVDRQRAIHQAIVACEGIYGLHLLETPTTIETALTIDEGKLIWLVTLEGKWMSFPISGGPPPAEGDIKNTEPAIVYDDCTIDIAPFTGKILAEPIE